MGFSQALRIWNARTPIWDGIEDTPESADDRALAEQVKSFQLEQLKALYFADPRNHELPAPLVRL